jgi:hypothetical protein
MKRMAMVVFMLVVSALSAFLIRQRNIHTVKASSILFLQNTPQEGKGCAVPKSWGRVNGVADRAIAFEDSAGTLRVLDTGPCIRGETKLIVKIERN